MDKGQSLGRIVKLLGPSVVPLGTEFPNYARVTDVLGGGRYSVLLSMGGILQVLGEEGLKVGDPVRVIQAPPSSLLGPGEEPGVPWSAFIPLGFGGRNASAELKVYIEKVSEKGLVEAKPAVYLVLECVTELQKPTQWSLYLKGRSIAMQVYPGEGIDAGEAILPLVREVEENFKKRGFLPMGPTVILKKRFKVPRGFHLNVKG